MLAWHSHVEPAEWTEVHRELRDGAPVNHRADVRPFWSVVYEVAEDADGVPSGIREIRIPLVTDACVTGRRRVR